MFELFPVQSLQRGSTGIYPLQAVSERLLQKLRFMVTCISCVINIFRNVCKNLAWGNRTIAPRPHSKFSKACLVVKRNKLQSFFLPRKYQPLAALISCMQWSKHWADNLCSVQGHYQRLCKHFWKSARNDTFQDRWPRLALLQDWERSHPHEILLSLRGSLSGWLELLLRLSDTMCDFLKSEHPC